MDAVGHPLFRTENRSEPPEIGFIQVRRRDADGWKRAPETFPAAELADKKVLAERFGGGEYELVARCTRNHRITSRARMTLPGEPKPLGELSPPAPTAARSARSRRPMHSAHLVALFEEGRLQARVFRMFQRDCAVGDIVRVTKLPIEEIGLVTG